MALDDRFYAVAAAISRQTAAQLLTSLRVGSSQTPYLWAISSRLPWAAMSIMPSLHVLQMLV